MKKIVAGASLAAAIAAGSVGVALINPLGLAGANSVTVQAGTQEPGGQDPADPAPAGPGGPGGPGGPAGPRGRHELLGSTLDELVAEGTITQEQADAIRQRLEDKVAALPKPAERGGKGGPGRGGFGGRLGAPGFEELAEVLGITADDAKTALKDGKTIAALAQEKGVDPQTVIDRLVATATTRIDEAVAAGKLDAARADELKASLVEHITSFVNEGFAGGHGKGRGPR